MDARLRVRLLGAPEASLDGLPLAVLKRRKTQALLYLLAVHGGPQPRALLTGLLWGDLPEAAAGANLRRNLFELRHALDPFLDVKRDTIALRHDVTVWVDHTEFVSCAEAAGTAASAQLEQAVGLYRGDFLAGFYVHDAPEFEHWVAAERARLRELALASLHTLAACCAEVGDLAHAIAHTRHALVLEPWREEAHCDLMRLLARTGQRGAALAQYELCRRTLAEELDVPPGPETERLAASIRDGKLDADAGQQANAIAVAFTASGRAAGVRPPDNLPVQVTPCVGRSQEIGQVLGLLADPDVRLVTLTGAGGMGKTRLALAVAQQLVDAASIPAGAIAATAAAEIPFPDGIFFVALAPLSAAAQVVPTIAAALNFHPGPAAERGGSAEQLADYLAGKRLLLVLDNFEQLAGKAAPWLGELLAAAARVKVLVTSREPLDLQEEQRFPVAGLAVPDPQFTLAEHSREEENAITLFVQVARRVQYSFRLTDANTYDVYRICRLVGGMPLAIQLAAGWVALLSPAEIAAELAADLYFLSTSQRDVTARHRSLAAVIEPSWRRLSPAEQDAFSRLCLCRGGVSRMDAQALTGCDLATLARLQQQSFLQYASESGRYQIHEVLRQYGAGQLTAAPDRQADAQRRHGRHYCGWLAGRGGRINTGEQTAILAALDAEVENCRAAWEWAAAAGELALLASAADALCFYFEYRGRFQEGFDACRIVLEQDMHEATVEAERLRLRLLIWQGTFSHFLGQSPEAHRLLRSSLARLEELADQGIALPAELACARLRFAELSRWGNVSETQAHLQTSQRLYQSIDDTWGAARALESLGFAWIQKLETVAASNCYRQAIALQESTGDPRLGARLLYRLALSLAMQGEKDESGRYLRESMVLARSLNDRRIVAHVLSEQALAGCFLGSFAEALSRGQESLAIFQDLNARYQLPNVHLIVANSLLHLGDWQCCRAYAEQSAAFISWERQQGFALWAQSLRSAIALATGDYGLARQHGLEAIRLARQTEVRYQNSSAHSVVGLAALLSGDRGEARRYLSESLGYFETGTLLQEMLLALLGVAFFLAHCGDEISAAGLYLAIRHYPQIADSVFCQQIAGRHLDTLLERLTPEQRAAVEAAPAPSDLRGLAMELRVKLEAMS